MIPRMTFFLAAALAIGSVQAQICQPNIRETTPASRFSVDARKGTVLDKQTGLMWKLCAEGQGGADCATGGMAYYSWGGALTQAANSAFAGYKDWRLPNIKELESLVEEKCYSPAINLSVFPNASAGGYWSSSPQHAYGAAFAWVVGFDFGHFDGGFRYNGYAVRLVRGGQ